MKHVVVNRGLLAWSLFVSAFVLAGFTLPGNDFQAGDVIRAADVNARFNALADGITALEGALADVQDLTDGLAATVDGLPERPGQVRFIVRVSNSQPQSFYDSSGGTTSPEVIPPLPGLVYIRLPGDSGFYPWTAETHPTFVQVIDNSEPLVARVSTHVNNNNVIVVETFDEDGNHARADFWLLVMNPID